ncbi:hypothetical protein K7W42_15675 [Deinococcus sp. HMF7604]|uniref:hypothetical protein n=1 Tax=Deinococcus betulae TaxID=2873312 RepID=UPI001CCA357F|nr:hypothetical protein [Deinococcus betulae]MBZ9752292.1 hypothetical protein [Deinococcus betulae]
MPDAAEASEMLHLTLGGVSVTGFVTPAELTAIDSGAAVDVVMRRVVAVHQDVGEDVPLGDVACTFIGGEPSPFVPE